MQRKMSYVSPRHTDGTRYDVHGRCIGEEVEALEAPRGRAREAVDRLWARRSMGAYAYTEG